MPKPAPRGPSRLRVLLPRRLWAGAVLAVAAACSAPTYFLDEAELARFEAAGPIEVEVDTERILGAIRDPGPYRLVPGDLLRITAPDALFDEGSEDLRRDVYSPAVHGRLVRVGPEGEIVIPVLGAVPAAGKTLLELEHTITDAAHPRYLKRRPGIVARVEEHHRERVTILGAVDQPGIVELRHDEMTLYGALSAAGGIAKSGNLVVGARLIRIKRAGEETPERPILLPVRGLNVPVANVALHGGEVIEVERYEPDTFTVTGLVKRPGAHEYPPEVTYNLMQAIAIAGGIDTIADPPYATVFRKSADGRILPATFDIAGDGLVQASGLRIKPGDVIVIGHTTASWTRALLAEILRFNVGFYVEPFTVD